MVKCFLRRRVIIYLIYPLLIFGSVVVVSAEDSGAKDGTGEIGDFITSISCDTKTTCPNGLECYSFPDRKTVCAKPNPCSYYRCPEESECVIAERYPAAVRCAKKFDSNAAKNMNNATKQLPVSSAKPDTIAIEPYSDPNTYIEQNKEEKME